MKKKVILGLIIFFMLITVVSNCFAVVTPGSLDLAPEQLLIVSEKMKDAKNASVFEANTTVDLSGDTVNGNVFILGRDVTIKDEVINGDLFVCAQNLEINENTQINGNVFIAAASAKINGSIERELYIAGSDVVLGETVNVGYDVSVATEHITVSGNYERNFNAAVSEMEIKEDTVIAENLDYSSDKEATISKEATIANINFSKTVKPEKSTLDIVLEYVLDFARYFVITMIILIIVIKKLPTFLEKMGDSVSIGSFGAGILGLILVPIAVVLFFVFNVTTTVAWALLVAFILILIVSMAITNIAVAKLLESKKESIKLPIWTAIVTVATWVLYQVPILGGILAFIWVMLGLGIVLRNCFARNK